MLDIVMMPISLFLGIVIFEKLNLLLGIEIGTNPLKEKIKFLEQKISYWKGFHETHGSVYTPQMVNPVTLSSEFKIDYSYTYELPDGLIERDEINAIREFLASEKILDFVKLEKREIMHERNLWNYRISMSVVPVDELHKLKPQIIALSNDNYPKR